MSYSPKTYRKQGGDEFVVASGGKISVETGGEVDIESGAALKLAGTAITATADQINALSGAGLAALLASGVGASEAYGKTTDGAQTLLAANATSEGDRAVLIIVHVDEVFADGDTSQTVFIVGQTGTTNKFMANTVLDDATAGTVIVLAGVLTEEAALLVTGTPAAGTGTGGISVTVLALPVEA